MKETNPGIRMSLKIITLVGKGAKSFGSLSSALGNPSAATLSRNLKVLSEEGWVVKREDQLYHDGEELARTSCSYLSRKTGTPRLIPVIEKLAEETGQSAAFAQWQGEGIIFTTKKEMAESFHYIPLNQLNAHNSYNGFNIVCLAYQKEGERIAAEPPPLGSLFSNNSQIAPCFKKIRKEQFFLSHDTVLRFTAPVFYKSESIADRDALFAGAIGISLIPRDLSDHDIERYTKNVKQAAFEAGHMLG